MSSVQTTNAHPDQLFCSNDGGLIIVDIPLSIAYSQLIKSRPGPVRSVYSTLAREEPYPSLEPKSDKARANVLARTCPKTRERNRELAAFIHDELAKIAGLYSGLWAGIRCIKPSGEPGNQLKRKLHPDINVSPSTEGLIIPSRDLLLLGNDTVEPHLPAEDLKECFICNILWMPKPIRSTSENGQEARYWIPPLSVVCNASMNPRSALEFEMNIEQLYSEYSVTAGKGQFDIILMDPPWSNRSVSRSGQYSVMDEKYKHTDPLEAVAEALPRLLADRGMIAIWITNKPSSRQRALDIFHTLGIEAVEEWIWIKVTTAREPVYDLNGLYRQPWEVCLVGRRGPPSSLNTETKSRKLIVACADLHSRKPAIGRMLVEHYQASEPHKLRKLEIFARYVSAGWFAWGDEAMKFNDESCWADAMDIDSSDYSKADSIGFEDFIQGAQALAHRTNNILLT